MLLAAHIAGAGSGRRLRHQVLEVERSRRHVHAVAVAGARPLLARSVGVDLDPQPVRVAEVERLRDAVVGGAVDRPARADDAIDRGRQLATRGMKPGHVEPPRAPRRCGHGVAHGAQHERRALALRPQRGAVLIVVDQLESQRLRVEGDAAGQVGDRQVDCADAQRGVDLAGARRDGCGPRSHQLRGYYAHTGAWSPAPCRRASGHAHADKLRA
jgi:hypothetical protein